MTVQELLDVYDALVRNCSGAEAADHFRLSAVFRDLVLSPSFPTGIPEGEFINQGTALECLAAYEQRVKVVMEHDYRDETIDHPQATIEFYTLSTRSLLLSLR